MQPTNNAPFNNRPDNSRNSQFMLGLFLFAFGAFWLLKRMNFPLPTWIISWEILLIGVGLFLGFQNRFKGINWMIPILVGGIFLSGKMMNSYALNRIALPLSIAVVGLVIAFRPRQSEQSFPMVGNPSNDDSGIQLPDGLKQDGGEPNAVQIAPEYLNMTAIFGGVKRTVVSKRFAGGEMVAVMGGNEVHLGNADFSGTIKIDSVNIMGGSKLFVPSDWYVESQMVAIFGGVEDKRAIRPELVNPNKRLIIEGVSLFGGIEIRNV